MMKTLRYSLLAAVVWALCGASAFAQVLSTQFLTAQDSGTACSVAGSCAVTNITNMNSVTVQVSGTFSGTLAFEATSDGGNTWFAVALLDASSTSGTGATTTTSTGQFMFANLGMTQIRLRATTLVSGMARVTVTRGSGTRPVVSASGGGGGGAPTDATYITQTPNGSLSAEQAMSALGTGITINTTSTGVQSIYAGTSCTNQFPRSLDASGAATCASVSLTADVTGDLPLSSFAQASAASRLLGRGSASGSGDFQEITLGSGLSMAGTVLSSSGGGGGITVDTTTVTGGTIGNIFFHKTADVVGELTTTGSGTVVPLQTAPTFVGDVTIGSSVIIGPSSYVIWGGRTALSSTASNKWRISDASASGGFTLDASTTDTAKFRNAADSAYITASVLALAVNGSSSGVVTVTGAAAAGTHTIKLPIADGSNGQFLKTDGSGQWSWGTASGGTGCVPSGSATQVLTDDGAGGCVPSAAFTYSSGTATLGTAGSVVGAVALKNATSGTVTVQPVTGALGTVTLSLPAATDTLAGKATTDAFTNKTLTSSTNVLGGVTMTLGSDAANDMYYRASGVLARFASANSGVVITSGAGVPSVSTTIPTATQDNITRLGTVVSGAWNATPISDTYLVGLVKPAVAVVAVANLTLSGEQTIDGQLTSGSLVLATAQTSGAENGPWVSAAGAWARPTWYPAGSTTQAPRFLTMFVRLGTTYQGSTWRMTTAAVTVDTTATTWTQTPMALGSTAVTGTLLTVNGGTGLAAGTSGGVPYFNSSTTMASSAALTANLPVIGGGAGAAPAVGTRSGNTTAFVTTTGAQTSGDCVKIDANGNHIANGSACGGSGGATTALDNLAAVSINASLLFQTGLDVGSTTKPARNLYLFGAGTYGTNYFKLDGTPTSTRTLTLPDATDTLTGKATTDTLTNKTFNTAGSGNVFQINGTGITAVNGTGAVSLTDSPAFTTQISSPLYTAAATAAVAITATAPSSAGTGTVGNAVNITASNATAGPSAGAAVGGGITQTTGSAARNTSGGAAGGNYVVVTGPGIGAASSGTISVKSGSDAGNGVGTGAATFGSGDSSASGGSVGAVNIAVGAWLFSGAGTINTLSLTGGGATITKTTSGAGTTGGAISGTSGIGQASSNSTGTGGVGGAWSWAAGNGGAVSGATTIVGGNGGAGSIVGGNGGSATTGTNRTPGNGGSITIGAGAAGTGAAGSGVAGTNGQVIIQVAATTVASFGTSNAASNSAFAVVGTPFTGGSATTNKPLFLIEPTGTTSTGWSTSGTLAGLNGPSGFTGWIIDGQVNAVSKFAVDSTGLLTTLKGVATAGWGIPAIYGSGRSTNQNAAVATVASYTMGAADGSVLVSANVLVTTSSAESFSVTVAYTDEGNTARTLTIPMVALGGTITAAGGVNFANGAVPYSSAVVRLRCKASTAITIATTGTFTGATYNVEGDIMQVK